MYNIRGAGINVPITRPNPVFLNRGNPKSKPSPVNSDFSHQIGYSLGGYSFIAYLGASYDAQSVLLFFKTKNKKLLFF
jgi:hypothetical protein